MKKILNEMKVLRVNKMICVFYSLACLIVSIKYTVGAVLYGLVVWRLIVSAVSDTVQKLVSYAIIILIALECVSFGLVLLRAVNGVIYTGTTIARISYVILPIGIALVYFVLIYMNVQLYEWNKKLPVK